MMQAAAISLVRPVDLGCRCHLSRLILPFVEWIPAEIPPMPPPALAGQEDQADAPPPQA